MRKTGTRVAAALLAAGLVAMAAAPADARRGGSFGSRGSRTYFSPRSTQVAPGYTPGLSRSMTPRSPFAGQPAAPAFGGVPGQGARRGFGFGGGLLAGVLAGGLLGGLFGHGLGGYGAGGAGGGFLAILIQLAILAGIVWLVVRLFRGRQPAPAGIGAGIGAGATSSFRSVPPFQEQGYAPPSYGAPPPAPQGGEEIALTGADQQAFETLLVELQDAFGREDYARLRAITTPEIMSYLAEELSDNATHGRRNEVSRTRLLDAEVSEAWREADGDYATIAMRYESVDVMRDRASGAVLTGDPDRPSQATEIWTFVRPGGAWGGWKVSAIQEA